MEQENQEQVMGQSPQPDTEQPAGQTAERTEADDYADVKNENREKAEVIETTARDVTTQQTWTQGETSRTAAPDIPPEQQETALSVLQETRDLLKKQTKQGLVRTICAVVIAIFIVIAVICGVYATNVLLQYAGHAIEQLDQAMGMVGSIEDLIHQISREIDALNLDAFNSMLGNMDTITGDIAKATTAISDATTGITDAVKQLGDFAEGLKNLNPFR